MSNNINYFYPTCRNFRPKVKVPLGAKEFDQIKPQTDYYHYSNPDSQGALIGETYGFPDFYFPSRQTVHYAYSDRLRGWDTLTFDKACKLIGGYEQIWAYKFNLALDETKMEFARILFNLDKPPVAVRMVHYYNVSSGYSCPVVIAVEDKS